MELDDIAKTTRADVLDMISCAQDYGHNTSMVLGFLAGLLGNKLSDEEIFEYAETFLEDEGYGVEDQKRAIEELKAFKERYIFDETEIQDIQIS